MFGGSSRRKPITTFNRCLQCNFKTRYGDITGAIRELPMVSIVFYNHRAFFSISDTKKLPYPSL